MLVTASFLVLTRDQRESYLLHQKRSKEARELNLRFHGNQDEILHGRVALQISPDSSNLLHSVDVIYCSIMYTQRVLLVGQPT
jgi:hypothetical protein